MKIANIFCVLMDEKNITDTLRLKAYLALEEKAPLVLGFENLISIAKLYIDSGNSDGYIEVGK